MRIRRERKPRRRWQPGPIVGAYARWIVRLRWAVLGFWLAAVVAAVALLPALGNTGGDISQLVSSNSPAVRSEMRSYQKFGFPLLSQVPEAS